MTISLRVELSHRYSWTSETRAVFKVILVPEKRAPARGIHYILLLDVSPSMEGQKIETAKAATIELLKRIPQGNRATLITFCNEIIPIGEYQDPQYLVPLVTDVGICEGTALLSALKHAVTVAKSYGPPGFIVLLTDGQPTDVYPFNAGLPPVYDYFSVFNQFRDQILSQFNSVEIPKGFKVVSFGIGNDYIESILALLADKTGGFVQHIDDPKQIEDYLPQLALRETAGKNVRVEIDSRGKVRLVNYQGPPVEIGALEGVVKIYGEVTMPPLFSGTLMTVRVKYQDPVSGREEILERKVDVSPASDKTSFLAGINGDLVNEYNYYSLMGKLLTQLSSNDLASATRTLQQMEQIAQQTKRLDLIESTRKLQEGLRGDPNTATKRLTSEVTKRMR